MATSLPENSKLTILLAEDEAPLRNLLQIIFEKAGFTLLIAEDGEEAVRLAHEHGGTIDLLVANVQMPNMTGPDLAKALKHERPELRVLLISGYLQGLLILDSGWWFLRKPFLPEAIIDKVHEVMAASLRQESHEG